METALNRASTILERVEDTTTRSYGAARVASDQYTDRMGIMGEVRLIGGALIFILLMVFVLTEIYGAVEFEQDGETGEYTGPFGEVVGSLEDIGATALVLLVLALLVIAASAIMRFFGSGGFGSR